MKHFSYEWLRIKMPKANHCISWAIALLSFVCVAPAMAPTPNAPDSLSAFLEGGVSKPENMGIFRF